MSGAKGRKRKGGREAADASAPNPRRAGMPAPESIKDVREIVRGGKVYRIIRTDETDEYEEPPKTGRARKRT
jgi:hypothetical protein